MDKHLSPQTQQLIKRIKDPIIQAEVIALFESAGALYGPPTEELLERVRFSVIKLSMEGPKAFFAAAELYRLDTRDLLVNAGFANDPQAHYQWCETILNTI